ncbi:MAG: S41 family peptidase [Bacteroidota bacterium]
MKNILEQTYIMRKWAFVSTFICLLSACHTKDPKPTGITADIRDSIYFYSKELYLWTTQLPDRNSFLPLTYPSGEAVINKVRTYSPLNGKGQHEDRFSFVMHQTDWDNIEAGTEADFGVGFKLASSTDLRINYAYAQSSAGKQGVTRGWRVLHINGVEGSAKNAAALNSALAQNTVTIGFQKPDGTQQSLTLHTDAYQTNPVLSHKILTVGNRKVGYVLFNTFLGNTAVQELQTTFNEFKAQDINELVVDLRYNGGGRTDIMESFANLLVPANALGKVMYKMQWNDKYASENRTITFANTPSGFNFSRIVFITTRGTASASELLINSLRPYMNVKLIGDTTVGKPVGFPVVPIQMSKSNPAENYVVAAVAFKNVNADNYGDYYDGLPVDKAVADDLTKDFGDPEEACLRQALTYLETGNMRIGSEGQSARISAAEARELRAANQQLDHSRKGLYYQMR